MNVDARSRGARRRQGGFTLVEAVASVAAAGLATIVLIPSLAMMGQDEGLQKSLDNLVTLGQAHATYASDWDGRQWTVTPDDLSTLLQSYPSTFPNEGPLGPKNVPTVPLGLSCTGKEVGTRLGMHILPLGYASNCSQGTFRYWHTQPFNQYVNGKVFDPTFYAPKDPLPKAHDSLRTYLESDCAWPSEHPPTQNTNQEGEDLAYLWSCSYSMALSAQYDPLVYANDSIGPTDPMDLEFGHRAPNLDQARYPEQKTFMLEHWWLQHVPPGERLRPGTNGIPYFFNLSQRSVPATLFYDLHVRAMPHKEAMLSDRIVQQQGEPSLVASYDPICFGGSGYLESYANQGEDISSYHVFTADGILGRDTVIPE